MARNKSTKKALKTKEPKTSISNKSTKPKTDREILKAKFSEARPSSTINLYSGAVNRFKIFSEKKGVDIDVINVDLPVHVGSYMIQRFEVDEKGYSTTELVCLTLLKDPCQFIRLLLNNSRKR